jgi:hypothetical protein
MEDFKSEGWASLATLQMSSEDLDAFQCFKRLERSATKDNFLYMVMLVEIAFYLDR